MGFNPNMVAANIATSNEQELVLVEEYAKEIVGPGFCVVIAGNSPRDFEYKKAVLEQIIEDTKATSLKAIEEADVQDAFIWRFIRVTVIHPGDDAGHRRVRRRGLRHRLLPRRCETPSSIHGPTRRTSSTTTSCSRTTSTRSSLRSSRASSLTRRCCFAGHPTPRMSDGAWAFVGKANQNTVDGHYGLPHHLFNDMQHDFFGPRASNYTYWLRRIKKSFDPNGVSEASNHITDKDT